eukprot:scpid25991/ scgid9812/ Sorbin and SH3 domain-containing protein 1; Ponsin; SH3 domain protein 5; SH3P12; c-Cbl-associated protein
MASDGEHFDVVLTGGAPWGFRLQGGREFRSPLRILKVTAGGKAERAGLKESDYLVAINGESCDDCLHNYALQRVKSAGASLTLSISRGAASKRSSSVFDEQRTSASSASSVTSPAGKAKVAPPWARSGSSSNGSRVSASSSSTSSVSTPAAKSSSSSSVSGQRPTAGESGALAATSGDLKSGGNEGSNSGHVTSQVPSGNALAPTPVVTTQEKPVKPPAQQESARSTTPSESSASTVSDGPAAQSSSTSLVDLPIEGGQKAKGKGWYKEMFKTIHSSSSGVSETTGLKSPTSYSGESRKSLPTSSTTASVPKWTSSRPQSTSSANVASSAKTHEDRRYSAGPSVQSGASSLPRRGSKEPPPSVSARADFFRKKDVTTAPKESGLSPAGSQNRSGISTVSPASTWSQRNAANSASSKPPPPTTAAKPASAKSNSLPRTSARPESTSEASKRSTPSPLRSTPEPAPTESYNNLNAALSDLNEAISDLEVAATTAAQKEVRKKPTWQPGVETNRNASVLNSQAPHHRNKMENVLEKKLVEGGHRKQQQQQPEEAVTCAPKRSSNHVITFPAEMTQSQPQPAPVSASPSPPPPASVAAVAPVANSKAAPPVAEPAREIAAPPPSTKISVEPEAVMQLKPPVEAFVIDLPPPQPEVVAFRPVEEDLSLTDTTKALDALLEAQVQAKSQSQQPAAAPQPAQGRIQPASTAAVAVDDKPKEKVSVKKPGRAPPSAPVAAVPRADLSAPATIPTSAEVNTQPVSNTAVETAPSQAQVDEHDGPSGSSHQDGSLIPDVKLEPGQGFGTALYNFAPQGKREIPLKRGDDIVLTRRVDANWMEGSVNGMKGIFPTTYVKVVLAPTQRVKSPSAKTPEPSAQESNNEKRESQTSPNQGTVEVREKKPSGGLAKARYSFQAESIRELSLSKGDEVTLIRKVDKNWYEGMLMPGLKGIIPASYLEVIDDVPIMKKTPSSSDVILPDSKKIPPGRPDSGPKKPAEQPISPTNNSVTLASPSHSSSSSGSGTAEPLKRFRTLYAYAPQNTDELELAEGDIIQVLEQCSDGWFVGTSERTTMFGTFPGNYVSPLEE